MSLMKVAAGRTQPRPLRRITSVGWVPVACTVWMVVLVVFAVFGALIAPYNPTALDLYNVYAWPSLAHPFGTDASGRDIFSRLIHGVAPTLAGPLIVVTISTAVGTVLAIIAAWFGGWVDNVIARVLDVLFAFPGLVVAILAVTLFGAGFIAPVLALSLAFVPVIGRILRTAAIRERNLPYIAALTVQGASKWTICFRHLLPNLLPIIVVQSAIGFSYALLELAAISYLGLGLQPPAADWGLMIARGQSAILAGHPGQSLIAAVLVLITVVSMNLLGDKLAQKFEIGER